MNPSKYIGDGNHNSPTIIDRVARSATSRKQWYDFWRIIRKSGAARSFRKADHYQHKVDLKDELEKMSHDGMVRMCSRFMDCDCAVGTSSSVMPAVLVKIMKEMDDIYYNAEGPGSIWFNDPREVPASDRRDLALEAFEDGHPHVVYH